MPSLADAMKAVDAQIFSAIGETMRVGATDVPGIFQRRYHEVVQRDGTIEGMAISFDCQYSPTVAGLIEGNTVTIKKSTTDPGEFYIFIRRIPDKGDETGRVVVELGTP